MNRTQIKKKVRAARKAAGFPGHTWEVQGDRQGLQPSGLMPGAGDSRFSDKEHNGWAGDLLSWSSAISIILPGESMDCAIYSRGDWGELEGHCSIFLETDGRVGFRIGKETTWLEEPLKA